MGQGSGKHGGLGAGQDVICSISVCLSHHIGEPALGPLPPSLSMGTAALGVLALGDMRYMKRCRGEGLRGAAGGCWEHRRAPRHQQCQEETFLPACRGQPGWLAAERPAAFTCGH